MSDDGTAAGTKACPRCAEDVRAAALVCRFCGHEFAPPPSPRQVSRVTASYPSTERPQRREADIERFRDAGWAVESAGGDPQGTYTVVFVASASAGPAPQLAPPPEAPAALPQAASGRAGRRPGEALGALLAIGVVAAAVAGFLLTGGPKAPAGPTGGGAATEQPSLGPSWPPDFRDHLCSGVVFDLTDGMGHLSALSDAAKNLDVAAITSEAAAINDRMQGAQAQLDALPDWSPAAALVGDLRATATSVRQGVNLLVLAAQSGDAAGVRAATAKIDQGSAAMADATTDLAALQARFGTACP